MPTPIILRVETLELRGEINDSETSAALVRRLPLRVRWSRWGEEYYGSIGAPLRVAEAPDARDDMRVGELAYWIPGNALCLFFGPTPASDGGEPRAASPVNPVGKVTGDFKALSKLGPTVTAELAAAATRESPARPPTSK